jgi:excisionase family DNA binding protein
MATNPIEEMFREIVREEIGKAMSEIKEMLAHVPIANHSGLIGAKEISEYLGISLRRAYELMELKSFPLIRIGSRKKVHPEAFSRWVSEQKEVNVS